MKKITFLSVLMVVVLLALRNCSSRTGEPGNDINTKGPVKVEIKREAGDYLLYRGGKPYRFNGVGFEFGNMESIALHGGTSFRTWRTNNARETGQEVLDKASKYGLTVAMCLEVGSERHGFDYDDANAVKRQFEKVKAEVMKYKDHPTLLIWIIGNELNLNYTNPKVYDAVNEISNMIHDLDPHHPTTTTIAGINKGLVEVIAERAPDLDLLSIQLYGDIVNLSRYIKETGWTRPYMVTEWGATGHWEVSTTPWGAPIEQTSTVKANNYLERYRVAIEPYAHQCLGSYVFLWGQKQERTPTWYGMFLESGEETEAIDVMYYIWNGKWPENRSPRLDSLRLDGKSSHNAVYLQADQRYDAQVFVTDPEKDPLTYHWEVKPESTDLKEGGDFEEAPPNIEGLIENPAQSDVTITAPGQEGPYRLFVYAFDGKGHAAHANIPFYVNP